MQDAQRAAVPLAELPQPARRLDAPPVRQRSCAAGTLGQRRWKGQPSRAGRRSAPLGQRRKSIAGIPTPSPGIRPPGNVGRPGRRTNPCRSERGGRRRPSPQARRGDRSARTATKATHSRQRPPGFSTRAISSRARSKMSTWSREVAAMTVSNSHPPKAGIRPRPRQRRRGGHRRWTADPGR